MKKEVAPLLRLQVYNETMELIQADDTKRIDLGEGLCLILPGVLWESVPFSHTRPAAWNWDNDNTQVMFPELTTERINAIMFCDYYHQDEKRIEMLEEMIIEVKEILVK
jgi:hypothetical protein